MYKFFSSRSRALRIVAVLFMLCAIAVCSAFAQKEKALTIVGTVIGEEVPDFGWPMEYESLKVFYVRVDRVENGKTDQKYIRIAYGHNPTSNPSSILPRGMFEGRSQWRYKLFAQDEFDATVSVSRKECDRIDISKSVKIKRGELGLVPTDGENDFSLVPVVPKCVPVKGFETEAISMEKLGELKGYWLSFGHENDYEEVKATNLASSKLNN